MTYALARPVRLDLGAFARATGLHPDFVRRLVALGLLEAVPNASGDLTFAPDQVLAAGRLCRLRAGFTLNYSALGLVVHLLDRIAELESIRSSSRRGGRSWT